MGEFMIQVSDADINKLIADCDELEAEESTRFSGMTYEQGVSYALKWILGLSDDHPLAE